MRRLSVQLFTEESEQIRFIESLIDGESKEQAIISVHGKPEVQTFPKLRPLPWQPEFIVRTVDGFKPSKTPAYEKGHIYTFDLSSAFAASLMLNCEPEPKRILDVCSAPGGKGIFAWTAFLRGKKDGMLVCNEVLRKRANLLISNIERCKLDRTEVISMDPSALSSRAKAAFDLVLVDAPCSGQSLLSKGTDPGDAFDNRNIGLCVNRQRRILGYSWDCVAPGGYLLYMTCTFNREENEKVVNWMHRELKGVQGIESPRHVDFKSRFSEHPCYRLYPHQGIGAGAFAALFRKSGELPENYPTLDLEPLWPASFE